MNLTAKLREWIIAECGLSKDATDDEFRKAVGDVLSSGKLSVDKFKELSTEPEDKDTNELAQKLDAIVEGLGKLTESLASKEVPKKEEKKKEEKKETPPEDKKENKAEPSDLAKMVSSMSGTPTEPDSKDINIRVKEAAEGYDTSRKMAIFPSHTKAGNLHPMAGRPMMNYSERARPLETSSQLDLAICGVFAKFLIAKSQRGGSKTFGFQSLSQHDKELLLYALENCKWSGASDGLRDGCGNTADIIERRLLPSEQKDLIDDAVSGGLEAAPIVFDDAIIQTPLLYGELFPLVNVVPLDRGRRIEGVATGTVTGGWGGVDATAIALFATAGYVSAFDTTVFRWEGAFRIGLDFLSDTPIDFGQHITQQYGERLLEDLDDVIAVGNGTTQPTGVVNTVGAGVVAWGGATSLGNYESLRFGVTKQEHGAAVKSSAVFCGTETSYQRARAIPVGVTDARRLGGMNYDSYQWMERPYKINASLANTQVFYAILARYRMYRRRGLTISTSTEGDTLTRRNELLIVAMARYGGQMERGATVAITTTAPA